jgi:hypothetical protein
LDECENKEVRKVGPTGQGLAGKVGSIISNESRLNTKQGSILFTIFQDKYMDINVVFSAGWTDKQIFAVLSKSECSYIEEGTIPRLCSGQVIPAAARNLRYRASAKNEASGVRCLFGNGERG